MNSYRKLWREHHGPIPDGYVIHHINGDHADNRIENLQMMTCAQHHLLHWRERKNEAERADELTVAQAADVLGVAPGTVNALVANGHIIRSGKRGTFLLVTTDSVERVRALREEAAELLRQSRAITGMLLRPADAAVEGDAA